MGQTWSEPDHPAASFQTVPLLLHPPDPPMVKISVNGPACCLL